MYQPSIHPAPIRCIIISSCCLDTLCQSKSPNSPQIISKIEKKKRKKNARNEKWAPTECSLFSVGAVCCVLLTRACILFFFFFLFFSSCYQQSSSFCLFRRMFMRGVRALARDIARLGAPDWNVDVCWVAAYMFSLIFARDHIAIGGAHEFRSVIQWWHAICT